jgi:hypothetical protein
MQHPGRIHLVPQTKRSLQLIASRPMPIRRSWLRTLLWTLAMLTLLGLATFMGYSGEYLVAGVFALFGLGAMFGVGSGSYTTECPVCGAALRGLIGLKRCPQCLAYGKISDGAYYELPPDFVNGLPVLALPLGDRKEMPRLCCACGAAATRSERLRIIRVEFAFDLDVPHCGLHTGGADLDSEPAAGKRNAQSPVLKVKSYAFYRACVQANYPAHDKRGLTIHA